MHHVGTHAHGYNWIEATWGRAIRGDHDARSMIALFLVGEHPSTRAMLRLRLELEADLTVVGDAGFGSETVTWIVALAPDVVVVDSALPMLDGTAVTAKLRTLVPAPAVVVLSLYDDPATLSRTLAAGASAVVSKYDSDALVLAAIRAAMARLSPP